MLLQLQGLQGWEACPVRTAPSSGQFCQEREPSGVTADVLSSIHKCMWETLTHRVPSAAQFFRFLLWGAEGNHDNKLMQRKKKAEQLPAIPKEA